MGAQVCHYESAILPLPFFAAEKDLPNWFRFLLYVTGLGYTFLGIAIISDIFMAGIEKVTSLKKRVKDKDSGRTVTVHVWNATVANLTLMALGSSAPEILLSVIEIASNEMYLGDLGAGTIVGSAAFNLLVISAVCVLAIPDQEVRFIKDMQVYQITAACSVLAYLWLMVVLMAPPSPNVVESWEAVLTLIFFPILVVLAYMADRGRFKCGVKPVTRREMTQVIPENVTKDELVQIEQQIREKHGPDLSPDQVVSIMSETYFTQRSRAYYRHAAMQQTLGMKKVTTAGTQSEYTVTPPLDTHDTVGNEREKIVVGFQCARYAFLENCGHANIILTREGPSDVKVTVKYLTRDGTAVAGSDYEVSGGTLTFEKGEICKALAIKIHDDNAYEENEEFYVDLKDPKVEGGPDDPCSIALSELKTVTVVIIDDDEPGCLRFQQEEVEVVEGTVEKQAQIVVERFGGASGTISCRYYTEDMNALAGIDYQEAKGSIELGPAVQSATIPITIMPKGRFDKDSAFNVILTDPTGCKFDKETDGAEECCICHVVIKGDNTPARMTIIQRMESQINSQTAQLGHKHWREQFWSACFVVGDADDDDEEEGGGGGGYSKLDLFMHIISVPWKLLFALVPPVDFCGGWACFSCALVGIAVVTAIVGDLANLVGCVLGINPEITAITFVALGTSLPDTFASQTAAAMDAYADASIGNITGSNSVNVFLGLGISWCLAAVYWESSPPDSKWHSEVFSPSGTYYCVRDDVTPIMKNGNAVFVVPAGSLWFNLMVFCVNALCAILHLWQRRRKFGGELGGPKKGFMGQYFSACFLVFQWCIYIAASSIFATINAQKETGDC